MGIQKEQTGRVNSTLGFTLKFLAAFLVMVSMSGIALAFQIEDVNFDTSFGVQNRNYDNDPVSPVQRRHEFISAYFQQEISYHWNGGKDSWIFTPYLAVSRYEDPMKIEHDGYVPFVIPIPIIDFGDTRTAHRMYGDIREFLWTHVAESNRWEIRTGIGKVFWGVTESQHLVDVVNQDDLWADMDGEDKLGQPMINFTLIRNYGNFDFFVLPGFREKVYQADVGRLNPVFVNDAYSPASQTNPALMISEDDTSFESGAEEYHTDFAFRWSHSIGINDIGLSFFQGTNRDPVFFNINEDGLTNEISNPSSLYPSVSYITPHYEQMTQVGLDYQATIGGWLLKFEGIHLDSDSLKTPLKDLDEGKTEDFTTNYSAITTGFEYTFAGVWDSPADVGVIMEYLWDSREFEATNPNQNDLFVGLRYAKNSVADPNILIGVIQDLDFDSYFAVLEANRRVGESSKIIIEAKHFLKS
jgi:hypothetical protein